MMLPHWWRMLPSWQARLGLMMSSQQRAQRQPAYQGWLLRSSLMQTPLAPRLGHRAGSAQLCSQAACWAL